VAGVSRTTNYIRAVPAIVEHNTTGSIADVHKGAVPECTLKNCYNGGECRLGIKPDPTDKEIVYDFWKNNSEYQYCECPDGFYGLQCEVTSTKCGSHHCFHGGECVTISKGTSHRHYCDCTTTHTATSSYAGRMSASMSLTTFATHKIQRMVSYSALMVVCVIRMDPNLP
jgi:hypothetical protein